MPRIAREMSAVEVRRLQHTGRKLGPEVYSVGGVSGLMLQVTPGGGKSWVLRTQVAGRRRDIGIGSFGDVPLSRARELARELKEDIKKGLDPIQERKSKRAAVRMSQKKALTFAEAAERFLAGKLEEFANDKHRRQWRSTLDTYALPLLGTRPVESIVVQDVQQVLEPIWITKTETATRLRGRIEAVLAWATVFGYRDGDNPARWKGNLDAVLQKPGRVSKVSNQPAVAVGDAAAWFDALRARTGTAARCLEFAVLCSSRSSEVRLATWDEIDLEAKLWSIPAHRMKAKRPHRVPLGEDALDVLRALPRLEGSSLLFPASRGGPLSDMALSAVMRRMQEAEENEGRVGWRDSRSGRPAVPHGLRSTFRDWAAELTDYPRDMVEIALAHNVGSAVERAYRRTDMVERRRRLMSHWANFLTSKK